MEPGFVYNGVKNDRKYLKIPALLSCDEKIQRCGREIQDNIHIWNFFTKKIKKYMWKFHIFLLPLFFIPYFQKIIPLALGHHKLCRNISERRRSWKKKSQFFFLTIFPLRFSETRISLSISLRCSISRVLSYVYSLMAASSNSSTNTSASILKM